ncbi:MAG: DNA repair protein RadC [Candidatus Rokubacteria bacterium]|nr:DNA repair protein RadC [Candidatus Rokubacteria bacterium]
MATPTMPSSYRVREVCFCVVREPYESYDPRELANAAAVVELVRRLGETVIPDDAREHFVVLMLNAKNRLVAFHRVSTGTLSASLVHPREVFGPALRTMGVAAVISVHNHPSGDPTPSREDVRLTRQLVEAGRLLDVPVLDHVVIGGFDPVAGTAGWVSFAERGLL